MNIYTVRDSLKQTIAGKQELLESWKTRTDQEWEQTGVTYSAMRKMVEINIGELQRILADVEICCKQYSEMGWQLNPERMGQ